MLQQAQPSHLPDTMKAEADEEEYKEVVGEPEDLKVGPPDDLSGRRVDEEQ